MFGKLHFGNNPKGFDEFKILPGQGDYYNPKFITQDGDTVITGYVTDIITDLTLDWMEKRRDTAKPFLLMYLHKAPHRTWMPAERHYSEFTNKSFPVPETFFDDYAHHPSEIDATISAAKNGWEINKLIIVFQPHLYSRTRDFYQDFAAAFQQSDILIVTDIYAAREKPIDGISAEVITREATNLGHKQVHFVKDQHELPQFLKEINQPDDMILTMGAGNIWRQCERIYEALTH